MKEFAQNTPDNKTSARIYVSRVHNFVSSQQNFVLLTKI